MNNIFVRNLAAIGSFLFNMVLVAALLWLSASKAWAEWVWIDPDETLVVYLCGERVEGFFVGTTVDDLIFQSTQCDNRFVKPPFVPPQSIPHCFDPKRPRGATCRDDRGRIIVPEPPIPYNAARIR